MASTLEVSTVKAHRNSWRSWAGLLLALVLIPFVILVGACLKAPIGNPETSRIDSQLSGVWKVEPDPTNTPTTDSYWVFQPYDQRTWLVGWFELPRTNAQPVASDSGKTSEGKMHVFKGWITTISGIRFLCLEAMFQFSEERDMKPEAWPVMKVDVNGPELKLRMIGGDHAEKLGSTTEEIERNLIQKISQGTLDQMLDEPSLSRRLDRRQYDEFNRRIIGTPLEKLF